MAAPNCDLVWTNAAKFASSNLGGDCCQNLFIAGAAAGCFGLSLLQLLARVCRNCCCGESPRRGSAVLPWETVRQQGPGICKRQQQQQQQQQQRLWSQQRQ
jgi:hypothetical protein